MKLPYLHIFVPVKSSLAMLLCIWCSVMVAQVSPNPDTTTANPNYDPVLAERLGGDDYGMKMYYLVLLKSGNHTHTDPDFIATCFRGHMDNISRLVDEGILVVAGPLLKNDQHYRGIFILSGLENEEAAQALLQTDPAIEHKLLDFELYSWYGSAAIPAYLPVADKIWKIQP